MINLRLIDLAIDFVSTMIDSMGDTPERNTLEWKRVALRRKLDTAHIQNCLMDR